VPGSIRVGTILVTPELVHSVRAVRPRNAKGQVVTGKVIVRATVSKSGAVVDAEVAEGNSELAPAALAAVRKWRYKPVLFNGEPVEVITEIDVPFKND
jgi:protein TonB